MGSLIGNICCTCCNKPISQSCTEAKSEKFWRATWQSNLADRRKECVLLAKMHLCEYEKRQNLEVFVSSGPPDVFTFSYST